MKKLLYNKIIINSFSAIILAVIFIFLLVHLKYPIIINDDMSDLITNKWALHHGRFIMEIIGTFIVIILPKLLNINIQDFAIFSQSIVKASIFSIFLYVLSSQFYKSNIKNLGLSFFICFSFFLIFAILIKNDFVWCFDTYQFFSGYFASTLFFVLFFQKFYDYYVNDAKINKFDFIIVPILLSFVATSNEMYSIVSIFLLFLLLYNSLKIRDIDDKRNNYKIFLFSFIFALIITLCSLFANGSKVLWEAYNLKFDFSLLPSEFFSFIRIYIKYIIQNNAHFILPILICFVLISTRYGKDKKTNKILNYSIFTLFGFFLFLFGTIFLPKTCIYTELSDKYWFLHPGLLIGFSMFLIALLYMLLGYIFSIEKNIKIKILVIGLSIVSCITFIFQNFSFEKIKFIHSYKGIKASMYINDKIALFYLKRGEVAVIPKEQAVFLIPDIQPHDLMNKPELYKQIYNKERARYLIYLEENYGINVSPGITFLPYDEAIDKYEKAGGTFSDEEFKQIKFSRLNNL